MSFSDSLILVIVGIIGFLVYIAIVRMVFRIDTQVRNQEALIQLLMKQWLNENPEPQEVDDFKSRFKIKS